MEKIFTLKKFGDLQEEKEGLEWKQQTCEQRVGTLLAPTIHFLIWPPLPNNSAFIHKGVCVCVGVSEREWVCEWLTDWLTVRPPQKQMNYPSSMLGHTSLPLFRRALMAESGSGSELKGQSSLTPPHLRPFTQKDDFPSFIYELVSGKSCVTCLLDSSPQRDRLTFAFIAG